MRRTRRSEIVPKLADGAHPDAEPINARARVRRKPADGARPVAEPIEPNARAQKILADGARPVAEPIGTRTPTDGAHPVAEPINARARVRRKPADGARPVAEPIEPNARAQKILADGARPVAEPIGTRIPIAIPVAALKPGTEKRRSRSSGPTLRPRSSGPTLRQPDHLSEPLAPICRMRSSSQAQVYCTPMYSENAMHRYSNIIPKGAPEIPLMLSRQPRSGEMAVSMFGSPLAVHDHNSLQGENIAECRIKLNDGTVLIMRPTRMSDSRDVIPLTLIDSILLEQLAVLRDNLDMIITSANIVE